MIDGKPTLIDNVKIKNAWEQVYIIPTDTVSELIKGFNLLMELRESYFYFLMKIGVIQTCRTSQSNVKKASIYLMRRINQVIWYCRVEAVTKAGYPLRIWFDEDDRSIMWMLYVLDCKLHKTSFCIKHEKIEFIQLPSTRKLGVRKADQRDQMFGHCIIGERELDKK